MSGLMLQRLVNAWSTLSGRPSRLRDAGSIVAGSPRIAKLWVVHYLELPSGTELVLVELGGSGQCYARLALDLADAAVLGSDLERATVQVFGDRPPAPT
jgi:hypothetical protein